MKFTALKNHDIPWDSISQFNAVHAVITNLFRVHYSILPTKPTEMKMWIVFKLMTLCSYHKGLATFQRTLLCPSSNLKMEAASSSNTLVSTYYMVSPSSALEMKATCPKTLLITYDTTKCHNQEHRIFLPLIYSYCNVVDISCFILHDTFPACLKLQDLTGLSGLFYSCEYRKWHESVVLWGWNE